MAQHKRHEFRVLVHKKNEFELGLGFRDLDIGPLGTGALGSGGGRWARLKKYEFKIHKKLWVKDLGFRGVVIGTLRPEVLLKPLAFRRAPWLSPK